MRIFRMAALSCALAVICLFTGCDVGSMSSLKDISCPYVGVYKCKKLQLGGEDLLGHFESIKLDLTYDGVYTLTYEGIQGDEGAYVGEYKLSEEHQTVTLSAKSGGENVTYVFPYENGKVIMQLLINEKLLYAEFSMVE